MTKIQIVTICLLVFYVYENGLIEEGVLAMFNDRLSKPETVLVLRGEGTKRFTHVGMISASWIPTN